MGSTLLTSWMQPLADLLFEPSCFHCGGFLNSSEDRLCSSCLSLLKEVNEQDHTYSIMKSRFMESNVVDEFHPAFYFEHSGVLQTVAHQLKYNEMMGFGTFLGRKIGELLNARNIAFDLIIPIPLNKRKYRERGYNQSEYIARGIRTVTRKPVLTHGIRRIKNTVTQTHLTAEERKKNMADAFTCSNDVKIRGKKILLVDDVITTGATIEESADVLKKCGAARVVAASAGLAILEKKK